MKEIKGISKEQFMDESLWLVKFISHRETYRGVDLKDLDGDSIRDVDIIVWKGQPDHLQECAKELERLSDIQSKIKWMSYPDLFDAYGEEVSNDSIRAEFKLSTDDMLSMVKAGKATITLHSGDTGKHFTYKIQKHSQKSLWFVSLMTGTNNDEDFSYMAHFWNDNKVHMSDKSCVRQDSKPALAFKYFMDHIDRIPEKLGVYHSGKCCRCGRTLTTPASVKNGIGPECIKMVNGLKV